MAAPPPISLLSANQLVGKDGAVDVKRLTSQLNQFISSTQSGLSRGLTFADNFAATIKTARLVMPAESSTWTAVTYANSWVDYGGALETVGYRIIPGGEVQLKGSAKSGTITATAFTLPTGYAPAATRYFACSSNGAYGEATVASTGAVVPAVGSNTHFSFDTVRFLATTPAACLPLTGTGWPVPVAHGLKKCVGCVPIEAHIVNEGRTETVGQFTLDWDDDGKGQVFIRSAWGLAWQKVYSVTLLMIQG